MKETRRQKLRRKEEIIATVWSSLKSHMPYMYNKSADGTKFHINCVKEYARVIYLESLDL